MNYAVIGLDHFGFHLAKGLSEQRNRVVAIDSKEERVKEVSAFIDTAYILDSTDKEALKEAGIVDFDIVLVSLGNNIEASILTTMALKDLNNRIIIAKAKNAIHGEILAKVGATKIVYPEREMAKKIVRDISKIMVLETLDISNSFKGVKFLPPPAMVGKPVSKVDFERFGIRPVALRHNGEWLQEFADIVIDVHTQIFCIGEKKGVGDFIDEALR